MLISEALKLLPGIALFPVTAYIAWRKLGANVSATFTVSHALMLPARISEVVLINNKDKPLAVFGIHAVIDECFSVNLDEFSSPIILAPLESRTVFPSPYSSLFDGKKEHKLELGPRHSVQLYVIASKKLVRCKMESPPHFAILKRFDKHTKLIKHTKKFNGIVYNDQAAYAITYALDHETKTAFIDRSGIIGGDWPWTPNAIPSDRMFSKESVKEWLVHAGFDRKLAAFEIDSLEDDAA